MTKPIVWKLLTNRASTFHLDVSIDDSNLMSPRGYTAKRAQYRLLKTTSIKNVSNRPMRCVRLRVNGKPLDTLSSLLPDIGQMPKRKIALQLFRYWQNNIIHFPVGLKAAQHPFLLINYWGYNICGFAAAFLSTMMQNAGIRAQKLPVQGHVVHQYEINGRWIILDADLNCAYRMLDNNRLAGYEDILKDPYLVHRTNSYGRYRPFDLERNRFSASLYDRTSPLPGKPPAYDSNVFEQLAASVSLYPGESIRYRYNETVENPLRESSAPHPKELGEISLMKVQYEFIPAERPVNERGERVLFTRYPIRSIRFSKSGREIELPNDRIVTNISIPSNVEENVLCNCQCSRIAAPRVKRGLNTIRLDCLDREIEAEFSFEVDEEVAGMSPPGQPALIVKSEYVDEPVRFRWNPENAQSIWIQVLGDDDQPLLDYIRNAEETIEFHPIEQTFFSNGGKYRVRARQQIDDIYSEWTDDIEFSVRKPEVPKNIWIYADEKGGITANWEGESDCEFLLFGSNRIDFVPDVFSSNEPVKGLDGKLELKSVKNLIARTEATTCRIPEPCAFYRIIAFRGGMYSNPSVMVDFSRNVEWLHRFKLIPEVLQTYHRKIDGENRYDTVLEKL